MHWKTHIVIGLAAAAIQDSRRAEVLIVGGRAHYYHGTVTASTISGTRGSDIGSWEGWFGWFHTPRVPNFHSTALHNTTLHNTARHSITQHKLTK